MQNIDLIAEPIRFNPLKHHLGCLKEFISGHLSASFDEKDLIRKLRHVGGSVMDVYTGRLTIAEIISEVSLFIETAGLNNAHIFETWAGRNRADFRIIQLSDSSQWTLKYSTSPNRYAHLFPARSSPFTFRVKANTLKSAVLYVILIGKDYVTEDDLNKARALINLSPVKERSDPEAVAGMIEILRS